MSKQPNGLWRWQAITISLLFLGYAGYYLCRSDYSVSLPLIIADLGRRGVPAGIATVRLGSIASLGVLAYAIGKFPSGGTLIEFGNSLAGDVAAPSDYD